MYCTFHTFEPAETHNAALLPTALTLCILLFCTLRCGCGCGRISWRTRRAIRLVPLRALRRALSFNLRTTFEQFRDVARWFMVRVADAGAAPARDDTASLRDVGGWNAMDICTHRYKRTRCRSRIIYFTAHARGDAGTLPLAG